MPTALTDLNTKKVDGLGERVDHLGDKVEAHMLAVEGKLASHGPAHEAPARYGGKPKPGEG